MQMHMPMSMQIMPMPMPMHMQMPVLAMPIPMIASTPVDSCNNDDEESAKAHKRFKRKSKKLRKAAANADEMQRERIARAKSEESKRGHVYVARSADTHGTLKVGMTRQYSTTEDAVAGLFSRYSTSWISPQIAHVMPSKNARRDEKRVHSLLAMHRQGNSEMFNVELSVAIEAVNQVCASEP
jgi:hypothetical protein